MAAYNCRKCGRALKNPVSVKLEKGPVCRAKDKQTDNLQREFDFMIEDIPDYVDMKKAVQSVIKDMDRLFPFCGDCKHISGGGDLLHCGKYTGFEAELHNEPGGEIYRCDACLNAGQRDNRLSRSENPEEILRLRDKP